MKVSVEKIEKNKVAMEISIEAAKFTEGVEKACRRLAARVSIPGFRRGKAPKPVVMRFLGKDYVYQEALDLILPEVYYRAVEESGIEPIDRPEIEVKNMEEGQDLVVLAKVEVKPEVKLGQYKGLEVKKEVKEVKDEDVQRELEELRLKHAQLIPREEGEAVEKGDIVYIDFEGSVDGKPFPEGGATDYPLELGSGSFVPGFEEQLVGKKVGEEVEVRVTFPADYREEKLAGKEGVFKVKIKSAKKKELAELDDEFAKDVSEFETLEELKTDLRNKLEKAALDRAEQMVRDEIIEKVVAGSEVEVPQVMVERRIDSMIESLANHLRIMGYTLEDYLKQTGEDLNKIREEYRDRAYQLVKTDLVLEAIAKAENIEATPEEVEKEIEKLAERYQQDKEQMRRLLEASGSLDMLKESIIMKKTINFLVENNVIA